MKQTIAMAALAVEDIGRALEFYRGALGWEPGFHNEDVAFFQMNGFIFGLSRKELLEDETGRPIASGAGAFSLAHNAESEAQVDEIITRAEAAGATVLLQSVRRDWGGYSGYIADPDGNAWEIAWNPAWKTSAEGHVTLGS